MTLTRRGFIGGALGSAAAAATAEAGTVRHFEGHPGRYGLLHDTTLCVGCRSCEAACKEVNGLPPVTEPLDDPAVFDLGPPDDGHLADRGQPVPRGRW
jgi:formate dehydrogenase iron-sulfur subunit